MFYVGIDISKLKHDCIILDDSTKVVVPTFSFPNNASGFDLLLNAMSQFDKESLKIGFEAIRHYGANLKNFLYKNGYSFAEINPMLIHNFSKQKSLRRTKTDSVDAKKIATFILQEGSSISSILPYSISELKALCRFRFCLMNQRKLYLLRLNNILDQIFSKFYSLFETKLTVTAFYIISHYGSVQSIATLNSRSYEVLRRVSRNTFSLSQFVRMRHLAKNTVGIQSEILNYEMKTVLSLLTDVTEKIEYTEKMITKAISKLNPPTLSIKGVSAISAAIILTEYGDVNRFSSPNAMLSFAGLEAIFYMHKP